MYIFSLNWLTGLIQSPSFNAHLSCVCVCVMWLCLIFLSFLHLITPIYKGWKSNRPMAYRFTGDRWHVTYDTWHLTPDAWRIYIYIYLFIFYRCYYLHIKRFSVFVCRIFLLLFLLFFKTFFLLLHSKKNFLSVAGGPNMSLVLKV